MLFLNLVIIEVDLLTVRSILIRKLVVESNTSISTYLRYILVKFYLIKKSKKYGGNKNFHQSCKK